MSAGPDGGATVPELLRGVWRREWIRYVDGSSESSTIVVWLQLDRLMADIRVPADHVELSDRRGLEGCSRGDLLRLLNGESSSGYTSCTPISTTKAGVRTATAAWHSRAADNHGRAEESVAPSASAGADRPAGGDRPANDHLAGGDHPEATGVTVGVGYQPVTAYPEPGLIEWNDDGTVLIERAPSGAYVEEWHLVPGSRVGHQHIVVDDRTQIYVAGPVAMRVTDRPTPPARTARLEELAAGADDTTLRDLANCEFSLAEKDQTSGRYRITTSTLPWLIGDEIGVQ